MEPEWMKVAAGGHSTADGDGGLGADRRRVYPLAAEDQGSILVVLMVALALFTYSRGMWLVSKDAD